MTREDAIEKYGPWNEILSALEEMDFCFQCAGDGSFAIEPCHDCAGTGKQSVAERVRKLKSFQ